LTAKLIPLAEHLLRWNSNKDSLNGFVDRIAELQRDLGGLLSQQAAQHPWKHANALAQIEARLVSNRAFYATIHDADEEVAQAFSSKHGGEADVQFVSCNILSSIVLLLMFLDLGRQALETTGWIGGGRCHAGHCKRSQGDDGKARSKSCKVETLPVTVQQSTHVVAVERRPSGQSS